MQGQFKGIACALTKGAVPVKEIEGDIPTGTASHFGSLIQRQGETAKSQGENSILKPWPTGLGIRLKVATPIS